MTAAARPSPPADPAPAPEPTIALRILLVEDNEDVRETTVEFIVEVGFEAVAVETAEAALVALAEGRYDVVLTDVSLPGMSGIDLVRRVRASDPSQCMVIASGYGADFDRHEFGPGIAVLAKPYDLQTLERTLAAVMAR